MKKFKLLIPFVVLLFACSSRTLMTSTYRIYAPAIFHSNPTTVGIETESPMRKIARWYNPVTAIKISVRGDQVLASPLRNDWTVSDNKLNGYRPDWVNAKQRPSWMGSGRICELPARDYWDRYIDSFLQLIIIRYNPRYLEIWNEPDAVESPYAQLFGCIGDGNEYGKFVKYAYSRLKLGDTKLIIGATMSPYSSFVDDMLDSADNNYDGVSVHCYEHFYDRLLDYCRDRYHYLQTLTNKPVYISETAVLYKRGSEGGYEQAQLEHFRRMEKLPTVWFWYTLCYNGWPVEMPTDMCGRPVWVEYKSIGDF